MIIQNDIPVQANVILAYLTYVENGIVFLDGLGVYDLTEIGGVFIPSARFAHVRVVTPQHIVLHADDILLR